MKLAIGTVQFGSHYGIANNSGQVLPNEVEKILKYCSAKGIDTLDTAINYGETESVLGQIGIKHWNVITKLPEVPMNCKDITGWVESSIDKSLERLRITKLDGVLLHRPNQLLEEKQLL